MNRFLATATFVLQVVFTEDMAENPLETLTEVLEFLGLDMLDAQGHKVHAATKRIDYPENHFFLCFNV